ncbi:GGDEF domain-containing protein [Paenibacillus thermotolerans]|uniref:GGDEF domain-containing protein n=1 Tax=Paenibacillus thermotolerans TaxID=3027807 RepID=UPI00236847AF|nr:MULTISPECIES: GGDEF domain-containing protein [unclassified Paenibacillus]
MGTVIQATLSNAAVIFIMHLFIVYVLDVRKRVANYAVWTAIAAIVALSCAAMQYLPVKYGAFRFDLMLIPLLLTALWWGWRLAFPVLAAIVLWRLAIDGAGASAETLFGVVLPVLFALLYARYDKSPVKSWRLIVPLSGAWLISSLPTIFAAGGGWSRWMQIVPFQYPIFLITALLLDFLIRKEEAERRTMERYRYDADHDSLTDLYNMRTFEETIRTYPDTKGDMFIVMLDIDHFKMINDTFGHLSGDIVLKEISRFIAHAEYAPGISDMIAGRYGGEEFIMLMVAEKKSSMLAQVESIRSGIERKVFYTEEGEPIRLTVSIGVAKLTDRSKIHRAIGVADRFLYKSKRDGRNRITCGSGL